MIANEFYVPGLMDLSKYRLEPAELGSAWDHFVERSPQGTIFSLSAFLSAVPFRPAVRYTLKKNQVVGGAALIEEEDGKTTKVAPHVIHGGVMLAPNPPEQNRAQTGSEEFRVTASTLAALAGLYSTVSFNSSPALSDLRPMLWHNYGTPGPHVQLDLRYTSYLDLAVAPEGSALDAMPLYWACNKSRRQSIRYGLDAGITVSLTDDIDAFLDLYRATFARQDLSVDPVEMTLLSAACRNLAAEDRLRMFAASTADGALGSIAVFGLDAKRAYYLYGANSPEMRNEHCGTLALWQGLVALAAEGVRECDLEGINSPKRGYFKLSFGGDIRPYFRVTLAQ